MPPWEGDGDGYDDHQLPHGAGQDSLPHAAQDQGNGPYQHGIPLADYHATRHENASTTAAFLRIRHIDMMRAAVGQPLAEDTLEALYSLR